MIKGKQEEIHTPYDEEQLELDAIELGAEDIEFEDGICVITTSKGDYFAIDTALSEKGYKIIQSDIESICENTLILSDEDQHQLDILLEQIEENDDVEKVWTNT